MSTAHPHPTLPPLPLQTPTSISSPLLGTITGSLLSDPTTNQPLAKRYLAIPYAQPPTRFKRAQPLSEEFRYGEKGETYEDWGGVCPQRKYSLYSYKNAGYSYPADPPAKYTEDCLQVNIWTPVEDPPEGEKWPVLFYIHGGWLQVGHNNQGRRYDSTYLIGTGALRCIVVAPGYRLNLFGFLACKELVEEGGNESLNLGLWDQKLALEWVHKNIHHFSGSSSRLTISGLSAGAHSAHQQLNHFLSTSSSSSASTSPTPIGIVLYSNAIPSTPRLVSEGQPQFEALCAAVGVSPPSLEGLRKIDAAALVKAMDGMEMHTFRVCQDHEGEGKGFLSEGAMKAEVEGRLGVFCKERGIRIMLGEVDHEEGVFSQTNPPIKHSELYTELNNYYPHHLLARVLPIYDIPAPTEEDPEKWIALHGKITADIQVYASQRMLVDGLVEGGLGVEEVFRYRINWKPKVWDCYAPPEIGVTHAHDTSLWWYSYLLGLTPSDLALSRAWLAPLQAFIEGRPVSKEWGTTRMDELRVLNSKGEIVVEKDTRREEMEELIGVLKTLARE